MTADERSVLRDAVAALMAAALKDLATSDGTPRVRPLPDLQRWWRYGQETFVALRPDAWDAPDRVGTVGWLDTFAEMAVVREAIDADTFLSTRVDTSVGAEFSLKDRPLDRLLIEHLLEPMITAAHTYEFSGPGFQTHYSRLEAGLMVDFVRLVEVVPLSGFVSNMGEIALADGLTLRPTSDPQMSKAIQFLAVPAEFAGLANSVTVSRFHQWALTTEHVYPLHTYKLGMPEQPRGPSFPVLEEPAERLVAALRIVCGGSVVASRSIHLQHDDDFPPTIGATASMSAIGVADISRPTLLLGADQSDAVRQVWHMLEEHAIQQDGALQTAIRRFVIGGSRAHAEDRLIDLSICSEALFLKRVGLEGPEKSRPAAKQAELLLAGDPVLGVRTGDVERFMRGASRLRNAVIHGDGLKFESVKLLNRTTTDALDLVVEDLARVLGRAIYRVLLEATRSD